MPSLPTPTKIGNMTLEDFEKALAEERKLDEAERVGKTHKHDKEHRHHRHRSHRDSDDGHRHKRRRHSREDGDGDRRHRREHHGSRRARSNQREQEEGFGKEEKSTPLDDSTERPTSGQKRDSWMEAPSALEVDYVQRRIPKPVEPVSLKSIKADFQLKIHENELNKHHLQGIADGSLEEQETSTKEPTQNDVDYIFGDSGSQWRMTKLKTVYRQAKDSGKSVEEVAIERYGDLRAFDDAREEETELERRDTYGEGYVGKEKPSGELFQDREMKMGVRRKADKNEKSEEDDETIPQIREIENMEPSKQTAPMDQSALNRLRAQMMKAKLRGSADATALEAEYNAMAASFANPRHPDTVVLRAMENRMLAGGQRGEAKPIDNKRGRERGLVEENEDMSIEDMVREERRTRGQIGGDGARFAERIAKDAKFDNDLEYLEENASKLAKRVQRSEINLKNTAISNFQKTNRILDNCSLCHHEDTSTPPIAPIVSLATRVYLTLPTEPEISKGGSCIVPIQHRTNLLECDDDEWEEIRNFMKSLTRMYAAQSRSVIFYENAAHPHRQPHAAMTAVPLPPSLGATAPAFFREAILSSSSDWTQHKPLIDTLAIAQRGRNGGAALGKLAFRRTLVVQMPYFHVWFAIDGGLGHVVEDEGRWPKGDLFAREVLGGMLDVAPDIVKRQGRWEKGDQRRVVAFRKGWEKWDWTRVLLDATADVSVDAGLHVRRE